MSLSRAVRVGDLIADRVCVDSNEVRALKLSGALSVEVKETHDDSDGSAVCDDERENSDVELADREATSLALPKEAEDVAEIRVVALPAALVVTEDVSSAERVAIVEKVTDAVDSADRMGEEEDETENVKSVDGVRLVDCFPDTVAAREPNDVQVADTDKLDAADGTMNVESGERLADAEEKVDRDARVVEEAESVDSAVKVACADTVADPVSALDTDAVSESLGDELTTA